MKKARQRADARNRTGAAQAQQIKESNIRQRRLEGGSRFNLRYKPEVPAEAVTPEAIMQALSAYVDFSLLQGAGAQPSTPGQGGAELRAC